MVLRGATQQILDEAERSLHDALCVLAQTVKETKTVYGGGGYLFNGLACFDNNNRYAALACIAHLTYVAGASEMLMAHAITELATKTSGKEAIAMEAFARALRQLPTAIADNGGYDSAELVSQLRAAHTEGKRTYGLGR